jgi:uridine phosphorylase
MASEVTHVFGAIGTKLVIQTGTCGGLAKNLFPGDLVCAGSGYCGEGAAQYYLPRRKTIRASLELLKDMNIPTYTGRVYTTSALFAEGGAEIRKWHDAGYAAVDMETATTFAVAEYFGMKKLAFLKIFDNPFAGEHLMSKSASADQLRKRGEFNLIKTLFAVIDRYIGRCGALPSPTPSRSKIQSPGSGSGVR